MIDFLKRVWGLLKPYSTRFYLGLATGIVAGLMEPLMIASVTFVYRVIFPSAGAEALSKKLTWAPQMVRDWIDQLPSTELRHHPGAVALLIAIIPVILLLRGTFTYLNNYFLQWASMRAITDLNVRLFGHILRLPVSFFGKTNSGELMSRIMFDSYTLHNIMSSAAATAVKDPVTLISLLAYLLWQQPKLTLISLIAVPTCVIPVVVFSRKVRKASGALQESTAQMSVVMSESFTSTRIIKAFNLEDRFIAKFRDAARASVSQFMRIIRATELPGPLLEFVGAIGVSLVLLYLALYGQSDNKAADFLTVVGAIFAMYRPLKNLTRLNSNLQQAQAASARVFEILDTKSEIVEPAHPKKLNAANAPIVFKSVSFAFAERAAVQDVNLVVKPGQLVALVGESGSGKTTLTNLLLRFYDPASGAIEIGGVDLRDVRSCDLRDQIAVVTQETILYHDTIANNIGLGRAGATRAEIEEAGRQAFAHDFIMEKPQGYETVVGEKGSALSGGQRQRIAIARAILKSAPILILDEATNALDTASENAVQAALSRLMQGRTSIVIAHRLSTIEHADVIVVMREGGIVETGSHAELIALDGAYRRLHQLQFRPQAP